MTSDIRSSLDSQSWRWVDGCFRLVGTWTQRVSTLLALHARHQLTVSTKWGAFLWGVLPKRALLFGLSMLGPLIFGILPKLLVQRTMLRPFIGCHGRPSSFKKWLGQALHGWDVGLGLQATFTCTAIENLGLSYLGLGCFGKRIRKFLEPSEPFLRCTAGRTELNTHATEP